MNKTSVVVIVVAAAVFAGVWYLAGGAGGKATSGGRLAQESANPAAAAPADVTPAPVPVSPMDPQGRPVPTDPRLVALMVTPENALIEYVKGPDGRVIQELDNDPNSPRFRKPLREYLYAGANVAGLTIYRNVGGQVEIVRVSVSYKDDGSIDQYRETLAHETLGKGGN